MLLTRAPVASKSIATSLLPLDLHVLGLSLAFILSQDQTLRCISFLFLLYFQRVAPELKTLTYCSCLDVDFFYFPFSRQGVKPVEKTSRTTLSIVIISMNFYCYLRVFSLKGNLRRENGAKIISFAGFFQIFWPLFSPVINFFPQKRRQR